jgi:hypothetical protein
VSNKFDDIKGDSLSKLIQVRAKMAGVYLKWTGLAIQDIDLLVMEYFHRKTLNECLWNGLRDLMAMPEVKTIPEPVYAQLVSIVLRAQANFELARAEMIQKNPPAVPPNPGVIA